MKKNKRSLNPGTRKHCWITGVYRIDLELSNKRYAGMIEKIFRLIVESLTEDFPLLAYDRMSHKLN